MQFSTETLMAYADGELDADTRAAIDAAMAADKELAQAVAEQIANRNALREKLHAAFDGALFEKAPERLLAAARSVESTDASAAVVDLAQKRDAKSAASPIRWSWPQWGAIAASLVIGVVVGRVMLDGGGPVIARDGRMIARGTLDAALTERLGGTVDRDSGIQLGVSFLANNDEYCRTFTLDGEQTLAGLACRHDDEWRIDALTRTGAGADASGSYRMAGAAAPALILGIVEDTISGDPLDAEQEAEVQARGWK